MNRFFKATFRPFFVIAGVGTAAAWLDALWPRWTVETVQALFVSLCVAGAGQPYAAGFLVPAAMDALVVAYIVAYFWTRHRDVAVRRLDLAPEGRPHAGGSSI